MNENDGETGLLDLLVLVTENLRLLVLTSGFVGLVVLGLTHVVPPTYRSQAVLALPSSSDLSINPQQVAAMLAQQAAAMMASSMVLDSAAESLGLREGWTPDRAGAGLEGRVKVVVGKDNLLRLEAAAPSPKEAQILADAVIDAWLKSTIPVSRERENLQKRLAYAQAGLDSVERLIQRISGAGVTRSRKLVDAGEVDAAPISLHQLRKQYLDDVLATTRALEGLQRDVVVKQPPTLPAAPVAPKMRLMLALSVLSALLLVFLWIFLRQAWARAAQVPESAQKQQRLLTALGLRKKRVP